MHQPRARIVGFESDEEEPSRRQQRDIPAWRVFEIRRYGWEVSVAVSLGKECEVVTMEVDLEDVVRRLDVWMIS
jgi:hypothetical protein